MATFNGFASQQIVQFSDCVRQDKALVAQVARTNTYSLSGPQQGPGLFTAADAMAAAIEVGIVQPVGDSTSILSR